MFVSISQDLRYPLRRCTACICAQCIFVNRKKSPQCQCKFVSINSALLEFMTAPSECLQRRVYNVTAMSFTPEELVNKLYKYVPELCVSYRPDTRQNIGKLDHHIATFWRFFLFVVFVNTQSSLINCSRLMASSIWWFRSTSRLAMEPEIRLGQIGGVNGERCTRKSYR